MGFLHFRDRAPVCVRGGLSIAGLSLSPLSLSLCPYLSLYLPISPTYLPTCPPTYLPLTSPHLTNLPTLLHPLLIYPSDCLYISPSVHIHEMCIICTIIHPGWVFIGTQLTFDTWLICLLNDRRHPPICALVNMQGFKTPTETPCRPTQEIPSSNMETLTGGCWFGQCSSKTCHFSGSTCTGGYCEGRNHYTHSFTIMTCIRNASK